MRQPGPRVALALVGLLAVGGRALASPTVLSDELADANQLAQRTADAGSHVSQRRQMQGRQRWCLPHRMRAARRFFLYLCLYLPPSLAACAQSPAAADAAQLAAAWLTRSHALVRSQTATTVSTDARALGP
jgi:hypothetical protein